MTSFNHYALGAVADWMRHETPYGRASIEWQSSGGGYSVIVDVPTGATARVELPGQEPHDVGSGTFEYTVARTV